MQVSPESIGLLIHQQNAKQAGRREEEGGGEEEAPRSKGPSLKEKLKVLTFVSHLAGDNTSLTECE